MSDIVWYVLWSPHWTQWPFFLTKVFHFLFPDCPVKCRRDFRPVCGSDGKTHPNECTLKQSACRQRTSLEKVHDGRCGSTADEGDKDSESGEEKSEECSDDCKRDFRPVCGSNGKTYNNICLLEQEKCTKRIKVVKAYDGACKGKQLKTQLCTMRMERS